MVDQNIPEELQTPDNIICHEFDHAGAGKRVIDALAVYGFVIVRPGTEPPTPSGFNEGVEAAARLVHQKGDILGSINLAEAVLTLRRAALHAPAPTTPEPPVWRHDFNAYVPVQRSARSKTDEAAAQSELVEAEREACAKIFDDEQKDALHRIDENVAYTRRIGRGDDLWSPPNELCRDRARWNESAAAKIRARTALDVARGKS